jgi:hypothetical protein
MLSFETRHLEVSWPGSTMDSPNCRCKLLKFEALRAPGQSHGRGAAARALLSHLSEAIAPSGVFCQLGVLYSGHGDGGGACKYNEPIENDYGHDLLLCPGICCVTSANGRQAARFLAITL